MSNTSKTNKIFFFSLLGSESPLTIFRGVPCGTHGVGGGGGGGDGGRVFLLPPPRPLVLLPVVAEHRSREPQQAEGSLPALLLLLAVGNLPALLPLLAVDIPLGLPLGLVLLLAAG